MKPGTVCAVLLALATTALAQDTSSALSGLQKCIQNSQSQKGFLNGWGVSTSVASAGRKMLQTAQNCADAAAISSAIPCTPTTPTGTGSTPTTPTTPTYGTPPAAGAASSNPCGDSSNPVPWTGLLCSSGQVTNIIASQLGPNFLKGCDIGTLGGLANLPAVTIVDFTASGLTGQVPASWSTGNWSGSLQSLTLAQNPGITGQLPNFSSFTALTSISISSSGFSGTIPLSSQGYSALVSFVAADNFFTGSLPASLPAKLTTLNVIDNLLNGTLPVYNSSTLGTLQVGNNSISGCLPDAWASSLTNITNIDLSYNDLDGPIPTSWQAQGSFPKLTQINIVGNDLCGSLGQLGTPVAPVGQNNPNATRLIPNPGTLPACTGSESCNSTAQASLSRSQFLQNGFGPAPSPGPALAPDSAIIGVASPNALPTLAVAG